MNRGEIYFIGIPHNTGSEIGKDRPAVIVGCQEQCETAPVVQVVFLTGQEREARPYYVPIGSSYIPSTALCEHVYSVDRSRIRQRVGVCTKAELSAIDRALLCSLGLSDAKSKASLEEVPPAAGELARVAAERDTYRKMYERLLDRCIH